MRLVQSIRHSAASGIAVVWPCSASFNAVLECIREDIIEIIQGVVGTAFQVKEDFGTWLGSIGASKAAAVGGGEDIQGGITNSDLRVGGGGYFVR